MLKRILKLAVIVTGTVLILAALAILALVTRLDGALKGIVEREVSRIYLTDVTIERVDVSPLRQTIEIHGLTVENPPKFRKGSAMTIGRIEVLVDLKSLFTATPRIRRILIEKTDVHLRYELSDGTNLRALTQNAEQLDTAPAPVEQETAAQPESEEGGSGRKLIVDEFTCRDSVIHVSTNLVPFSSGSLDLAKFSIKGLG
ncbi:MAG: hypothetical protein QG656_1446, partial [Candidatus Hydrogenedentes bacterium]|nr:hypothetical protein [Candidatus Hydrogenedentota bacterium]